MTQLDKSKLLHHFWEGSTSLMEEEALKNFVDLEDEQSIESVYFTYTSESITVPENLQMNIRNQLRKKHQIAPAWLRVAVAAIMIGIFSTVGINIYQAQKQRQIQQFAALEQAMNTLKGNQQVLHQEIVYEDELLVILYE